MSIIEIERLAKSYRVYQKREGLRASLVGLFHRQYRQVEAVRGINVRIEQGEFVAFLGPNGAGKTTTLKFLSGVITPTAGTARVMGYVPWKRENAYRRRFALVMGQKNQLWWDLPAAESFRLHQHIYRIEARQFEATLAELTELLGVGGLLGQPVRELSLGERMKMELIAALLHSPDVLFLDEPTIGLDVVAQHNVQLFLKHYQQVRKVTVLLTSHYMKDVAALCRRVIIIAEGRIIYDGSLSGIIDRFSGHKIISCSSTARGRWKTWGVTARSFPSSRQGAAAGGPRRGPRGAGRHSRRPRGRGRERRGPAAGRGDRGGVFPGRRDAKKSVVWRPEQNRSASAKTQRRLRKAERRRAEGGRTAGSLSPKSSNPKSSSIPSPW